MTEEQNENGNTATISAGGSSGTTDGVRQTDPVQDLPATGKNPEGTQEPRTPENGQTDTSDTEVFDAEYVRKLRKEAAEYRTRAKDRDSLAQELFYSRVGALGLLADPTDLPYDDTLLNDAAALQSAVDELLSRKPHLASRTPHGDIGQGVSGGNTGDVDFAAILRANA